MRIGFRQMDILDSLARSGPMTVAELVEDTGIGQQQTYDSVQRLVRMGHVEVLQVRRRGVGRPPRVYQLTDHGLRELRRRLKVGVQPGVPRTYPSGGAYLREAS